jgi:hypothetical protein
MAKTTPKAPFASIRRPTDADDRGSVLRSTASNAIAWGAKVSA